jgi:hypothetical protein
MYDVIANNGSNKCGAEDSTGHKTRESSVTEIAVASPNAIPKTPYTSMIHNEQFRPHFYGPWVRASDLSTLFCSWDLAYRCARGGWLTPVIKGKRRTIYRFVDVLACIRRIESGELPPPRSLVDSR